MNKLRILKQLETVRFYFRQQIGEPINEHLVSAPELSLDVLKGILKEELPTDDVLRQKEIETRDDILRKCAKIAEQFEAQAEEAAKGHKLSSGAHHFCIGQANAARNICGDIYNLLSGLT